ncbi:MAG: LacI family transcriptional regulator [Acidimicrobiia bacterium]|nr:LacI family transcriptional regulator [Acidimicrobiia bacterium]
MTARITLKDVASEAGVHVSTASRALNPATQSVINDKTVERVLAAAEKLGYRPHPLARGLRTNQTMSVGVVIPDVENPLFGPIIAGAEAVLMDEGYSMLIGNADRGEDHATAVIDDMVDRHVDGLILATALRQDPSIEKMIAREVPIVLVNRTAEGLSVPSILGDDHAGIGLAVQHLASLGHVELGHVAGPSSFSTGLARSQAFRAWTQTLGLDRASQRIEEADRFQVEPGYEACTRLLRHYPEITAIVAANDLLALGCYRSIRDAGLRVGDDVSVTGYNDMPLLDLMQPPMTAVRVSYRQMGREAAAALLGMIGGVSDAPSGVSIRLAPTLAVRSSSLPPPAR